MGSALQLSPHPITYSSLCTIGILGNVVYTLSMGKRETGVGNNKKSRSKKTAKRLAAKAEMLAVKASKRRSK
jgi:hypothetical protein